MKSLKGQLIAAIAMTLVAIVTISSSTYAWFSMNNQVTATGMTVNAKASSSLVITTGSLPSGSTSSTTVALTSATVSLAPAAHDSNYTTYTKGLKYVSNAGEVDAETGLKHGTTDLAFSPVTTDNASGYYKDFAVFIAAAGTVMSNQDLTVKITNNNASETNTHKATSIDFYVDSVGAPNDALVCSTTTYKGTLNLAGLDCAANDATTTKTTVTLVSDGTIPSNTATAGVLRITMRVYFDGGLQRETGKAFIYANAVDATQLALNVQFDVASHS